MNDSPLSQPADLAARLVADLMPIAVAVCGPGEAAFVAALRQAGTDAEIFAPAASAAFDLAILLTATDAPDPAQHGGTVAALAASGDRLLLVPVPLGRAASPDLTAWFELFAEHGYQPVVDYDAGFLGAGAFLVDRNAIAAEEELAAFADRVSQGGGAPAVSPVQAVVAPPAEDREAPRQDMAARDAELADLRAACETAQDRATRAETELAALRHAVGGWGAIGRWVSTVSAAPSRDSLSLLRAAMGLPPKRPGLWRRLRGKPAVPSRVEAALLRDATLIRQSQHFDAPWYIASHPELAESGDDPVWHYVLRGAAAGAEPGPYFDSAPWRAAHPDRNPLAEAARQGKG